MRGWIERPRSTSTVRMLYNVDQIEVLSCYTILRSQSLYRSAAALVALVNLSTLQELYEAFYYEIATDESSFHLETLAMMALDKTNPERKIILSLTSLARARLYYQTRRFSNPPAALSLWQRFLQILKLRRCVILSHYVDKHVLALLHTGRDSDYDPLLAIGNASLLFEICAFYTYYFSNGTGALLIPEYDRILDLTFHLPVFLVHSFIYLCSESNKSPLKALVCQHVFVGLVTYCCCPAHSLFLDQSRWIIGAISREYV